MLDYSSFDDIELLKAIKSDDSSAFEELYNRYGGNLVLFINKKIEDIDESKDLVQEIFVKIWEDRHNILEINSISNYMYKVAVNKCLNLFRKHKITQLYIDSFATYLEQHPSGHEEYMDESDREKLLTAALKQLPDKMKEVFELRYYYGLSNQEVATRLGISTHTVATHMKRALKSIRQHIGLICYLLVIHYL